MTLQTMDRIMGLGVPLVVILITARVAAQPSRDPCATSNCRNGGTCIANPDDSSYCMCYRGYTGETCESELENYCASNPCQNGASCISSESGFLCACRTGFGGSYCETEFSCDGQLCRNGGSCMPHSDGFMCLCPNGYTGSLCENGTDYCSSNPCDNGGKCKSTGQSFRCECASGYTGFKCQTWCDDAMMVQCFVDPCQFSSCPKYPTATCSADYCGGCFDRWNIWENEVNCTRDPDGPTTITPDRYIFINETNGSNRTSRTALYGNDLIQREAPIVFDFRSYIDLNVTLPDGKVTAFYFYDRGSQAGLNIEVMLQIWRPIEIGYDQNFTLIWQKLVNVESGFANGSLHEYVLSPWESPEVQSGDLLGFTSYYLNPISRDYAEDHVTMSMSSMGDVPLNTSETYIFDESNYDVYSIAVNVTHDATNISHCMSMPCLNGGSCVSSWDGWYVCMCAQDYYGIHCESAEEKTKPGSCPSIERYGECWVNDNATTCYYDADCPDQQKCCPSCYQMLCRDTVENNMKIIYPSHVDENGEIYAKPGNDLYGHDVTYRISPYPVFENNSRLDLSTNLPSGTLKAFYLHARFDGTDDWTVLLQIWRRRDYGGYYTLLWQRAALVPYQGASSALYEYDLHFTDQFEVRAGDRIGWAYTGGYSGISFDYDMSFETMTVLTGGRFPEENGTYRADQNDALSQKPSLAVKVTKDPRGPCGSMPCMNGGSCISWSDDFTCYCSSGFTGRYCQEYNINASSARTTLGNLVITWTAALIGLLVTRHVTAM